MNNTLKTVIWVVVVVVVVWAGYQAFFAKKTPTDPIKIGYFGPLTGPVASTGEPVYELIKFANKENAVNGTKIEVIYEDDACDAKKAVSAAQKLLDVDKVNVLISGVCSGSTLAVAPLANERKIVLITPVSAAPKITEAGDYVFRISGSSKQMAEASANMVENLGFNKIAILYENNEYPVGWKDAFSEKFLSLGSTKKIIAESFNTGTTDVRTQLLKLKSENPDAIFLMVLSPPSANIVLQQSKELGIKSPLLGNEVFSLKPVITKNQEAMEGMLVLTYEYDLEVGEMKQLLENYKQEYNKELKEEIYGALGYDTYNVLLSVIKACNSGDPECLKNELYKIKNFQGASGLITIDSNGDTYRHFILRKVEGGNLVKL